MKSPQGPESLAYREQNHRMVQSETPLQEETQRNMERRSCYRRRRNNPGVHADQLGAQAKPAERAHYSTEEAVEWIGKGGR
ncbi:hypothetical protein JCM14124_19130 [Humidesulfovibrio idahonensis]